MANFTRHATKRDVESKAVPTLADPVQVADLDLTEYGVALPLCDTFQEAAYMVEDASARLMACDKLVQDLQTRLGPTVKIVGLRPTKSMLVLSDKAKPENMRIGIVTQPVVAATKPMSIEDANRAAAKQEKKVNDLAEVLALMGLADMATPDKVKAALDNVRIQIRLLENDIAADDAEYQLNEREHAARQLEIVRRKHGRQSKIAALKNTVGL